MFGKKKKMAAEIVRLTYRVSELEERLCPCEQHQWIMTGTKHNINNTIYIYKCRRCGKTRKTLIRLPTWKESTE